METPFRDFVRKYADSSPERCHTPGHKGLLNPRDITEIDGALDEIEQAIKQSEANAAKLFGASASLFSCSGSTLAIYAMLTPFANSRITAVRGAHRSLIDAAVLLGLEIDWVYPGDDISRKINPETSAVFITHIDYYGKTADITEISRICREKGVPLLADNAHGAYLAFTDRHPIRLGAAMSADSAHKTLPALTGAAYLHFSEMTYYETAKAAMGLFGTSSPNYPVLDSLDMCNVHLADEKDRAEKAFGAVRDLKTQLSNIGYVLADSDALRVTIDANALGYTGAELSRELIGREIIPEMSDNRYVILLFSTITEPANTDRVARAAQSLLPGRAAPPPFKPMPMYNIKLKTAKSPREAYFAPSETVPFSKAKGRVCGEIAAVTPPGIPLIIPGEIIPDLSDSDDEFRDVGQQVARVVRVNL